MAKHLHISILERLRDGDEAAFNEVYNQFSPGIYNLAFRYLQDAAQSEEILQETFISLWLNKEKIDVSGDLWVYLFVIAKRKSLDILRNIKKSKVLLERLSDAADVLSNCTEEKVLAKEFQRLVDVVVNSLPEQQQKIFRLSRQEGLSHNEIAGILNISANTVKNHMVQANKTLKFRLQHTLLLTVSANIIANFFSGH